MVPLLPASPGLGTLVGTLSVHLPPCLLLVELLAPDLPIVLHLGLPAVLVLDLLLCILHIHLREPVLPKRDLGGVGHGGQGGSRAPPTALTGSFGV